MARTPATHAWDVEGIKAALRRRYGSLSNLARSLGKNERYIAETLRRPDYSVPAERQIAEALDVPLHELWPRRWNVDGTPKPRRDDAPIMAPLPVAASQNARAA
jgi:Ner family transcriptional regulator